MKIEQLRALSRAATAGPWRLKYDVSTCVLPPDGVPRKAAVAITDLSHGLGTANETDRANAALIAAARNHLDALLDVAEASDAVVDVSGSEAPNIVLIRGASKVLRAALARLESL